MYRILFQIAFVTLLSPYFLLAQDDSYEEPTGRIYLVEGCISVADPVASFGKDQNIGGGVSLSFLMQLDQDLPSFIGMEYSYIGLDQYDLEVYDSVEDLEYKYGTNTSMMSLYGVYRHYIGVNILGIESFVDGKVGVNALSATTSVTSPQDQELSEFDWNAFDINLSYGVGVGLHYTIYNSWYITAKVSYLKGLSGKYYIKDNEYNAVYSSLEAFSQKRGTSDVIRYDLGVTFAF